MTTLFLIRHGETVWNHEQRIQGQVDVSLSEAGKRQTLLLRERLCRRARPSAVYSSDLSRAFSTALILFGDSDIEISKRRGLRERSFGAWEGLAWPEIEQRFPREADLYFSDPTYTPPDAENWSSFVTRVLEEVDRIVLGHPDETVALVCHGGTLRAVITDTLGIEPFRARRIEMTNTGVHVMAVDGGERRFLVMNDTCHLEGNHASGDTIYF